jgi:hypothetical protein
MTNETRRDHYAGALVALIGAGAAWQGRQYGIGSLTRMGPGFFPVALGIGMVVMGVLIAAAARPAKPEIDPIHGPAVPPDWRGWAAIIAAVLLFLVLAQYAGLLPATFACVFVAAMGDRQMRWSHALLLAAGLSLFGILLFVYALQVQIPVFGRLS